MLTQIKKTLFFVFLGVAGVVLGQDLQPTGEQEYRLVRLPKDLPCDKIPTDAYILLNNGEVRAKCSVPGGFDLNGALYLKPDGSYGMFAPWTNYKRKQDIEPFDPNFGLTAFMPNGLMSSITEIPFSFASLASIYDPITQITQEAFPPSEVIDRFSDNQAKFILPTNVRWEDSSGNITAAFVGPGAKKDFNTGDASLSDGTVGVIFWDFKQDAWLVRYAKDIQIKNYEVISIPLNSSDITHETENYAIFRFTDINERQYAIVCSAYEGFCIDYPKFSKYLLDRRAFLKNGDMIVRSLIYGKEPDFQSTRLLWQGQKGYKIVRFNHKITGLKPVPANALAGSAITGNVHGDTFGIVYYGKRDARSKSFKTRKARFVKWDKNGRRFDLSHYFPKDSYILKALDYYGEANDCGDVLLHPSGSLYKNDKVVNKEPGGNSIIYLLYKQRDRFC